MGVVVELILQNLLCVGLAVLFAAAHAKPRAADFGLQRPRLPRAAGLAVAVWLGLFVFTAAWVGILGLEDDGPNIIDRLAADQSTSHAVLVVVMVAVAVPLGEEFLFRGFVFRALSNWRGTVPTAILTGVGFAATHVGWLPIGVLFPVAMFGFVLCLLYPLDGVAVPAPRRSRLWEFAGYDHGPALDVADAARAGIFGARHAGDRPSHRRAVG